MENEPSKIAVIWNRFLIIVACVACVIIGSSAGVYMMQREAIDQGFAHYHGKTGNWQWGVSSDIMIAEPLPPMQDMGAKNAKRK